MDWCIIYIRKGNWMLWIWVVYAAHSTLHRDSKWPNSQSQTKTLILLQPLSTLTLFMILISSWKSFNLFMIHLVPNSSEFFSLFFLFQLSFFTVFFYNSWFFILWVRSILFEFRVNFCAFCVFLPAQLSLSCL
jgi:hypothetical protein